MKSRTRFRGTLLAFGLGALLAASGSQAFNFFNPGDWFDRDRDDDRYGPGPYGPPGPYGGMPPYGAYGPGFGAPGWGAPAGYPPAAPAAPAAPSQPDSRSADRIRELEERIRELESSAPPVASPGGYGTYESGYPEPPTPPTYDAPTPPTPPTYDSAPSASGTHAFQERSAPPQPPEPPQYPSGSQADPDYMTSPRFRPLQ
jgi:hypothetical protein